MFQIFPEVIVPIEQIDGESVSLQLIAAGCQIGAGIQKNAVVVPVEDSVAQLVSADEPLQMFIQTAVDVDDPASLDVLIESTNASQRSSYDDYSKLVGNLKWIP